MNIYTTKALGGLFAGGLTTSLKHIYTKHKTPIINGSDWKKKFLNPDTFNLAVSTAIPMLFKSTPTGLITSLVASGLLHFFNKPKDSLTDTSDGKQKNLEEKHAAITSKIVAYAKNWTDSSNINIQAARFGGKDFWENNKDFLGEIGLKSENFYTEYKIPGNISPKVFHDGFMYSELS